MASSRISLLVSLAAETMKDQEVITELNTGQECGSKAVVDQLDLPKIQSRNENSTFEPNEDDTYQQTLLDHNYSLHTVGEESFVSSLNDSSSLLFSSNNIIFDVDNVFEDSLLAPDVPISDSVGLIIIKNDSSNAISGESNQGSIDPKNMVNYEAIEENVVTVFEEVMPFDNEQNSMNDIELIDNVKEIDNNHDNNYEPSSESDHDESYNEANHSKETHQTRKRAKRGKANKETWTALNNKNKRMKGEEYEGRRKNEKGNAVFDVKRQKRTLKPRCTCIGTQKNKFKCTQVTEERRQQIFEHFWSLDWGQRKIEVHHLVDLRDVRQRTVPDTHSRRSSTLLYHLKQQDNEDRIRVCKTMFLNSLDVGEWTIRNWVLQNDKNNQDNQTELDDQNVDTLNEQNDKHTETVTTVRTRQKEHNSNVRKLINEFFDYLPKLESHYCRKDTNKLYLEPHWQSKAQLFRQYQSYCESQGKEHLVASTFTFHDVFEACNLGLYSPKKDQCDICCAYQQGNMNETGYAIHITRKNEAREEKAKDKEESNEETAVYTMDVQAVLLCPYLKASALYYRRKLKVHNFTLYNLKSGEGYCYLWDESEGGVNADEFATIVNHFISTEIDLDVVKHVILYSDGCTSQNRNAIMANALLLASHETGVTITQKYLEKGHTQMECDSIHSNIEKKLRNREIYSPAGYVEVCKTARMKPQPYKVVQLDHTFFKKYNAVNIVSSIRPGKKKGDPVVTDLRCIQYKPDGTIKFKLSPHDQFSDISRRNKKPCGSRADLNPLYNSRLPIDSMKFKHLQELKFVIPKDIHNFYDNLPHQ